MSINELLFWVIVDSFSRLATEYAHIVEVYGQIVAISVLFIGIHLVVYIAELIDRFYPETRRLKGTCVLFISCLFFYLHLELIYELFIEG